MDALQWILNAYSLVFASLLLTAGVLADRLGPTRMLWWGAAIFGVGSLAAAAAPSEWPLITIEAALGVGAAVRVPASLSLLTRAYTEPGPRARALGIWASVAAVVFAASPAIGGVIIDLIGWRGVFAINIRSSSALSYYFDSLSRQCRGDPDDKSTSQDRRRPRCRSRRSPSD